MFKVLQLESWITRLFLSFCNACFFMQMSMLHRTTRPLSSVADRVWSVVHHALQCYLYVATCIDNGCFRPGRHQQASLCVHCATPGTDSHVLAFICVFFCFAGYTSLLFCANALGFVYDVLWLILMTFERASSLVDLVQSLFTTETPLR